MDANLTALLTVVVTSIASVIIALINAWNQRGLRKAVDAGNTVITDVHTIANGRTEQLLRELAQKNDEIARLSRLLPPEVTRE